MSWLSRLNQVSPLHTDTEDEFGSTNGGSDDSSSTVGGQVEESPQVPEDPPPVQPVIMVNYDSQTGVDSEGAMERACHRLKGYEWDPDLGFYFNQIKIQMRAAGVQKNYTKMLVLTTILPPHVREEVKPILRMQESEFEENTMPYKILKDKIIKIFKPPQEATFERAKGVS